MHASETRLMQSQIGTTAAVNQCWRRMKHPCCTRTSWKTTLPAGKRTPPRARSAGSSLSPALDEASRHRGAWPIHPSRFTVHASRLSALRIAVFSVPRLARGELRNGRVSRICIMPRQFIVMRHTCELRHASSPGYSSLMESSCSSFNLHQIELQLDQHSPRCLFWFSLKCARELSPA